ncbi:MAG: bifunctional adenosylcobinamide kinase/adenosylcobinamide-phosphate guanylyltransferase [Elusimicrobia bacterium]|nr:bifunctional adenosylcobinamide kinase/adenosylcobinamide-phosphate guanylyltransferase [Elusimicrobiota bacterium]
MGKIILILGGVKSGKSSFAVELAKKSGNVIFVATASPGDSEMKKRIEKHKKSRPKSFKTVETSNKLSGILKEKFNTALIDCLTIFVSNCMLSNKTEKTIIKEIEDTLKKIKNKNRNAVIVSNEVGYGIVPKNKLAREFRDVLGNVNQAVSRLSDKVYFLISGNPVLIKK